MNPQHCFSFKLVICIIDVFYWDGEETSQQKPELNSSVGRYRESRWNVVLWKLELGPVLTDTSAGLKYKVGIRDGGSQRCVHSGTPHPPGKVWMN